MTAAYPGVAIPGATWPGYFPLPVFSAPTPYAVDDPFALPRVESWRFDLLTLDDAPAGTLDGVEAARFDFSVFASIRGSGSLTWSGSQPPDWTKVRIQPWYTMTTLAGSISWPVGVFIPSTPDAEWDAEAASMDVELYDKLLVLDQDVVGETYGVAAGAIVTDVIRALIEGAGETAVTIVDSAETLSAPMVWEAGTSRLRIVNDLLAAINYFSLSCDGYGVYRAEPYTPPSARAVARVFADDEVSIYLPKFSHSRDYFDTPNTVTLVARSDGETPALTSTAINADPASPTSTVSRGRTIAKVETDVEATSQAVLDALAARRLVELSRVASTVVIEHAYVPLDLNDAVRFRRTPAGLDVLAVAQKFTLSTKTPSTVTTTLQEVAA